MGILELHFHDCEFSPSMTVGDDTDDEAEPPAESVTGTAEEETGFDVEPSAARSRAGKSGLGALLALAALVLLGALVKRKRGGREDGDERREQPDVDVQE